MKGTIESITLAKSEDDIIFRFLFLIYIFAFYLDVSSGLERMNLI